MTVDEVLATEHYTDRRGREWGRIPGAAYWGRKVTQYLFVPNSETWADEDMRLLIERDKHRKECPGLSACNGHPVPSVITPFAWGSRDFEVYAAWANTTSTFKQSLPEAMDAARALAVGE